MVWLFAVAFDRAVWKHRFSALALEHLGLNVSQKELGGLLRVSKLAYTF
jgi:hypothetical protein